MNHPLNQSLKQIETLITRPAESLDDPEERDAEFQRRLERTRRLMATLGDPQDTLDIIHIGGTSGKGSVAILCEAVLLEHGIQVGTHTSPYLQTPLEKVRVGGLLVDAGSAIALTGAVLEAAARLAADAPDLGNPHYAEAWLGLALRHFADAGCRAGMIEVGMGGRFDATNVVTPRVSVISTVHYDHTRVLGETLAEIAYHKAGIIKPGVPAVVGEVPPAAWSVIVEEAQRNGARVVRLGRDITCQAGETSASGGSFDYRGINLRLDNLTIGLLGAHQFANAAVALAAVEIYAEALGVDLDEAAIRRGLAAARFAGRLEVMQAEPMAVLDGAHNQEKIGALVRAVRDVFDYRRLVLMLGLLEAKSADPIVRELVGLSDTVIVTQPNVKGKPAIPAHDLGRFVMNAGAQDVRVVENPVQALQQGLDATRPGDLLLATGSLYLIGTVRSYWYSTDAIIEAHTMFPNREG